MNQETSSTELHDANWQQAGTALLIGLQAACLVVGPWLAAQALEPAATGLRALPLLALPAALIGCLSAQWAMRPAQRWIDKTLLQLAQWLLLLLAVRVGTWLAAGWPSWAMLRGWLVAPLGFFDGAFLVNSLLASLAWQRGWVVGAIFQQLGLSTAELIYAEDKRHSGWWRRLLPPERAQVNRLELLEQYTLQWMIGGVFVALFAAALRLRVDRSFSITVLGSSFPPTLIAAAISYFLIGLVLLSQARLAMLRARWSQEGVEIEANLPQRWQRTALVIIGGLGVLAALLPLGSTWQLGGIVNTVVLVLVRVVIFIVFAISVIFGSILSLFGYDKPLPELPEEVVPAEVLPPQVVEPLLQSPAWLPGVTFWLTVAMIMLAALWLLFGRYRLTPSRSRLLAWLANLWRQLRGWGQTLSSKAQTAVRTRLPRRRLSPAEMQQPWRLTRLSSLSAREQIRYFYLSMVRRAAEMGATRGSSQTPTEFLATLEQRWPDTEADTAALTEAFIQARYDVADFSRADLDQAKSTWQRVKKRVQERRRATAKRNQTAN
ncbi:MAG: DUF4129 domain-containing protein [Caldilineales bacterium]